jgi:oligoribonuclease NrnB/cAMP/cGMP phosphodiesterase (DHH superfamily)
MNPLVIYHAHCTDGFGAAYAAYLKLGEDAEYLPIGYHESFDVTTCKGRDVYIMDFSFPLNVMTEIVSQCTKLVWLDHHKSVFDSMGKDHRIPIVDDLFEVQHVRLDSSKSGAMLAWEYFHGGEIPDMIKFIDDRDRWQFKLQHSKAFHAGMQSMKPWSFQQWVAIGSQPSTVDHIITSGNLLLNVCDQAVARADKAAAPCVITMGDEHLHGLIYNSNAYQSEIGNALAVKSGTYGLVWYVTKEGTVAASLRSEGDYDVSRIAKFFGGGGHMNAAGCELNLNLIQEFIK